MIPAPAPSQSLVKSLEQGVSDAYAGDDELSTGIASAGVKLASDVSKGIGGFFDSLSDTLSGNPHIVTYFLFLGTGYAAYRFYKKHLARKKP